MAYKLIMRAVVLIAIIVAILSLMSNYYAMVLVVFTSHFFAMMIPILAVGGLLKWIFFSGNYDRD